MPQKILGHVSAAGSDDLRPFPGLDVTPPQILSPPNDWHVPGLAGSLFVLSALFNAGATTTIKPSSPLWGTPVTISLTLGLCGTALVVGYFSLARSWDFP